MHERGFSLVELSIVLVILGLLTGGILTGQSLIRASEMRAVSTEINRYTAAMHSFRDKYFALAGDMPNATQFWDTDPGGCPAAANTVRKTQTCNGDGNGSIPDGSAERWRYWQQLANAGLIEGSFTGTSGLAEATYDVVGAQNVPPSKLSNGLWSIRSLTITTTNSGRFTGNYPNVLQLGSKNGISWNDGDILKPEEAWNIDTKIDDALPGRGKMVVSVSTACSNTIDGSAHNTTYNLSGPSVACYAHFLETALSGF